MLPPYNSFYYCKIICKFCNPKVEINFNFYSILCTLFLDLPIFRSFNQKFHYLFDKTSFIFISQSESSVKTFFFFL